MRLRICASRLADYVQQHLSATERGAVAARHTADGDAFVAIFGNDHYRGNRVVKREVALVRRWLRVAGLREVGFGTSRDVHSWALVVRVSTRPYRTAVAQAFRAEMIAANLEEIVQQAWAVACQAVPDRAGPEGPGRLAA